MMLLIFCLGRKQEHSSLPSAEYFHLATLCMALILLITFQTFYAWAEMFVILFIIHSIFQEAELTFLSSFSAFCCGEFVKLQTTFICCAVGLNITFFNFIRCLQGNDKNKKN
ncbi:hypothetical protein X975_06610, partial [Stegodyphus mimosarum]